MIVWVRALYQDGVILPRHRVVAPGGFAGTIVLETVRHKALDRPTKRLRFKPVDAGDVLPDLLDAELRSIEENEFVFGGIEAQLTNAARPQYLAQAWRVTVPAT